MVIVMERDPTGKIPESEEIAAVACAVQNMHLTASAIGLGGFWSSPALVYTDTFRTRIGLGESSQCLGLFYLGWPRSEVNLQSRRTPAQEKTFWQSDKAMGTTT